MENKSWVVSVEHVLEPVLPLFIEMRWQDLAKLKKGIELGDFESLKKLCHRLLGTPGAFGFDYIVGLAHEMEAAIQQKDIRSLSDIASKFEDFMKNHKIKIE